MKDDKSTESKQEVEKTEKTALGVYPSSMRESVERMVSSDALNTDDLKKANPGLRLRYLNKAWRVKEGKTREWQFVDHGKNRPVGDLDLGFMPEDLARKKEERQRMNALACFRREKEKQHELAEKIYRDSEGTIRVVENGHDKYKNKPMGTTKYFSVPDQIS